jgi:hypothetical protein
MPYTLIRRVVHRGQAQTQTTEVASNVLRIGRGTVNDLHLDDLSISLTHATIELKAGRYVLRDLTGVAATYVNQAPVSTATVGDGDVVRIGPYILGLSLPVPDGPLTIQVEEAPELKESDKVSLLPRFQLAGSRWSKTALTLTMSLLVLGSAVFAFGFGKHRFFMPGGISIKHAQFAAQCANCHQAWKVVWAPVPDKTCLNCHAGPPHFGERSLTPTPRCASCHSEHQGKVILAALPDSKCVQCHGDLKVKDATFPVVAQIHTFHVDHPEFAVSLSQPGQKTADRVRLNQEDKLRDQATLKLNHKLHLDPQLMGPEGPEQLKCIDCHRADERGAYLRPISYERDCMRCHLLDFDDRFPGKVVRHAKQPEEIREELQAVYAAFYVRQHGLNQPAKGSAKRLPGASGSQQELFVDEMTERAERFLYSTKSKKCLLCHAVERPVETTTGQVRAMVSSKGVLPTIVKTNVPGHWLPHSRFKHAPHLGLPQLKEKGCVACHEASPKSEKTSDVLLPRVASCQACHFEPGGAHGECIACHVYHDKTVPLVPGLRSPETPQDKPATSPQEQGEQGKRDL